MCIEIQDDYIEKYLEEKNLNLTATLDAEEAYKDVYKDVYAFITPSEFLKKKLALNGFEEKRIHFWRMGII